MSDGNGTSAGSTDTVAGSLRTALVNKFRLAIRSSRKPLLFVSVIGGSEVLLGFASCKVRLSFHPGSREISLRRAQEYLANFALLFARFAVRNSPFSCE